MDTKKIFDNLTEWDHELSEGQEALLGQLMETKKSNGLSKIDSEEVRELRDRMLAILDDTDKVTTFSVTIQNLEPTPSETDFI